MRSLGTTIGSAVIGVVLAQMTVAFGRWNWPPRTASGWR